MMFRIVHRRYLPGGDKDVVTEASTTIDTVVEAQRVLQDGGAISLTCYPGHLEGQREEVGSVLLHSERAT